MANKSFFIFAAFIFLLLSVANAEPIKTPQHVFPHIDPCYRNHPGEYPFPTDMTFHKYADHVIDPTTEYFDPELVKKGDTIFLVDWYQAWFVRNVHPHIKDPYILISNDSDGTHPCYSGWEWNDSYGWPPPCDVIRTFLYDSKVAAWFCKNMMLSQHPKVVQIPIGPSIIWWNGFPKEHLIHLAEQAKWEKKHLIYLNMQRASHSSRPGVIDQFKGESYCFSRIGEKPSDRPISKEQFYEELSQAVFTPAPSGFGFDTCRVWESVLLGCIPIIPHSYLDDLYEGLPVLFVHEWEDVNLDFLIQKRQEIAVKNLKKDKAFYDYWDQKIKEMQKSVREETNDFSRLERTRFQPETLDILARVIKDNVKETDRFLYRGSASGFKPFEFVDRCPFLSALFVQDRWGAKKGEIPHGHLQLFTDIPIKSVEFKKIIPLDFDDQEDNFLMTRYGNQKTHLFFDLSYLRHELTEDLDKYYLMMSLGTLFCGNMAEDSYVKELLDRFSTKYEQKVEREGDIWFFKK